VALLTEDPERYRREMADFLERCPAVLGPQLFTCGIGPGCIDAYGRFQPCLTLRHPDLTVDLKISSLQEAYATLYPQLEAMRGTDPLFLQRCARCFLRALCEQLSRPRLVRRGPTGSARRLPLPGDPCPGPLLGAFGRRESGWEVTGQPGSAS
jgi:MoaA/NifB/PqqE/SkfB family radical SAM enzyme